jgi:hypothetical protein
MEPLNQIPMNGYINGVAIGPKGRFCVVAVGQEPRLGRWNRVAGAKNRFGIVQLRSLDDIANDEDNEDEQIGDNDPEEDVSLHDASDSGEE